MLNFRSGYHLLQRENNFVVDQISNQIYNDNWSLAYCGRDLKGKAFDDVYDLLLVH
jgi:hypothetical protein